MESRTLADRVSEQIATAIVKGEIPPGYKISEPELARTYGISRGPLREAIRRLEGLRLVVRIPHVGARVVSLSTKELLEIYYIREAMEGMAARLAAENMSDEEVEGLRQLVDQHEQSKDLLENRSYFQKEGDLDFHYRIVQGSKNSKLMELLGGELYHLVRMYRYQFSMSSNRPKQALQEHRLIAEAIAQRDGELAEILMRRHVSNSRKNIERKLQEMTQTES
ncbi:GntR family transcriptional regulator [Balneatrix alpica]|uniref:GntR family transcriptional regulator n=1 Tax=Balneatrix alpica TaxID=75684 RepID=A0ABV5ZAP9_9GAMM|nr:GntR family transcriptional regulator [Balneatrix alpica]